MISVVVPCKNRIEKLDECLESIIFAIDKAKKRFENLETEIIVINDHSEEGFSEKIKNKYSQVNVIDSTGFGPGYARNLGISICRGEYIFFTDSDCVVDEEWIINGYNMFLNENPIVIQGTPWLFQKNVNKFLGENEEKLYEIMFSTYVNGNYSTMTDSRNLLVNKKIAEIMGREVFSEKIDKATSESRVFGKKCNSNGIEVYFDKNVKVYHEDSRDMKGVCKQKYRHGTGRVLIWEEKPKYEHLEFRYYDNPINSGIDKDYILPAHTAFLLGYYKHLNDKAEFNKFMDFVKKVFAKYDRKIEDYDVVMEMIESE